MSWLVPPARGQRRRVHAPGAECLFDVLKRSAKDAGRLTGLELLLQLNKSVIDGDETPRHYFRDVKYRGRICLKQGRVGNSKLRVLQGLNVRCMRLIQQRGEFSDDSARLCHFGNLYGPFEN